MRGKNKIINFNNLTFLKLKYTLSENVINFELIFPIYKN